MTASLSVGGGKPRALQEILDDLCRLFLSRHAEVRVLFRSGRERGGIALAVVPAGRAVGLRHRGVELGLQVPFFGHFHALWKRDRLVVEGGSFFLDDGGGFDVLLRAARVHPSAVGEASGAHERVVPADWQEDRRSPVHDERREVLRAGRGFVFLRVQRHRLQVRAGELDLLGFLIEAEHLSLRTDHHDLRLVDPLDEEGPHRDVVPGAGGGTVLPEGRHQLRLLSQRQSHRGNYRATKGFKRRSSSIVVPGPCPQTTGVAPGREKSFPRIEARMAWVSPPRRSVRPIERRKRVSPEKRTGWVPSSRKQVEPGVCPGVWMARSKEFPKRITSPSAIGASGGRGGPAESPKSPACSSSLS